MCREIANGGRRCPCSRGDRRRAYQRMRYGARQAAAVAPALAETANVVETSEAVALAELEQRRTETAAAVNSALAVLRDPDRSGDSDVHEAYLNAVLEHGAVIRDIAHRNIDQAYAEQGLDDVSVAAETAVVAARLEQVEARWREAQTRTDRYLTADGGSFVSDAAAAAIDSPQHLHCRQTRHLSASRRTLQRNQCCVCAYRQTSLLA